MSYDDESFDAVIVDAGLHHCHSPHRALLEMYRVARKCAVAFEARDSLLMRAAIRAGLTEEFERSAISADRMRAGESPIPEFRTSSIDGPSERLRRRLRVTNRLAFRRFPFSMRCGCQYRGSLGPATVRFAFAP
ncbi:methyltransferase domain-containing protein [Bradyrhizobium sp.]|uniref:methyltransferase domain-containing protein n=1 Tax=Bradyrhizobium sp. TaxID=376 RepID=UPI003BB1DB67